MAHFAEVDENNIVLRVIVADQEIINTGLFGDPSRWIQTSYNTYGGKHLLGGTPLRKNYAGVGYTYDPVRDAFIPIKEFPSWTLDEETCTWVPPIPRPEDPTGKYFYQWDEEQQKWWEYPYRREYEYGPDGEPLDPLNMASRPPPAL